MEAPDGNNGGNGRLYEKIEEVNVSVARVEEGVKSMHKRQDTTNGNIESLWKKANELDKAEDRLTSEVASLKRRHKADDEKDTWWKRQGIQTLFSILSALLLLYVSYRLSQGGL